MIDMDLYNHRKSVICSGKLGLYIYAYTHIYNVNSKPCYADVSGAARLKSVIGTSCIVYSTYLFIYQHFFLDIFHYMKKVFYNMHKNK